MMMSEERPHEPDLEEDGTDPLDDGGPPDRHSGPDHSPNAAPLPQPAILRAAQAYLLPPVVRAGFELALAGVCEATRDEGMHELEQHPVLALALAVVADVEAALSAVGELDQLYEGGSSGSEERRVYRVVKDLEEELRPGLEALRQMQDALQRALDRLPQGNGEAG